MTETKCCIIHHKHPDLTKLKEIFQRCQNLKEAFRGPLQHELLEAVGELLNQEDKP